MGWGNGCGLRRLAGTLTLPGWRSVVVWFYFLCACCCSVAVGICETKGFGEGRCEEAPCLWLRSGSDYDYAHEHNGTSDRENRLRVTIMMTIWGSRCVDSDGLLRFTPR